MACTDYAAAVFVAAVAGVIFRVGVVVVVWGSSCDVARGIAV